MILAAYDLGTTGCKASFFDEGGSLLATAYREYPTYYEKEGWVEQDPADWKRELVSTTVQLLERTGVQPGDIACLSFSGHMMGCVPVDARGETLSSRTMLWADTRSIAQAEDLINKIGWERFYRETGSGLDVVLYPAAKIPWIRDNQPDLYRRAAKFVGTKDAICAWLTGRIATDFSEASDIGLLHLGERCWHRDLLRALEIDLQKLPDLLPSTTVIGNLRREAAQEMGLREGTPVVLGGGDVSCGTAGAGAVRENVPYMCIGSAGWVSVVGGEPVIDMQGRPMALCHVVPDLYCSQIIMYSAGVAYKWIRDEIFATVRAEGEAVDVDPRTFALMDDLAAESPPGARGVLFLPYLRPGGAPHYDIHSKGAFLGLSLEVGKLEMIRAALEGVAFNVRMMVGFLEKKEKFQSMRIIGGGAASALWKQIFADVLGKPVLTLSAQQEANTVGAALVGAIGVGILDSFEDIDRFTRVVEEHSPDPNNSRLYDGMMPVFTDAFASLRKTNESLGELSEL